MDITLRGITKSAVLPKDMKTIFHCALAWGIALLTGFGEVVDVEGKGGAYYEVHLERDGHHWFYIIP